jgi:LPS-assembly protein
VPKFYHPETPRHALLHKPCLLTVAVVSALIFACKPQHLRAQQLPTPSQTLLDDAIREGLKFEKTLPTPGGIIPRNRASAREIEANKINGVADKKITAEGNVVLKQDSLIVTTDKLSYDKPTDTATANGNIRLDRNGDIVTGVDMLLAIDTDIGFITQPTYFFSKNPSRPSQRFEARGAADKLNFEGENKERLFNAEYTTCKAGENEWSLKVKELALDRSTNIGTAINGYVEFKGIPIMYAPFMTFPLNNERKSGFLPPSFGSSSRSGAELAVPYYWNIAPNTDATITPKIFTRRGMQLGGELRYLRPDAVGQLDTEFLPNDSEADRNRYYLSLRHFQNLAPYLGFLGDWRRGWSATINAQKVSDDNYFRDLSTRIANTTQTNLPRDISINYASDFGNFNLRNLHFQTLQDPLDIIVTPYRLAPQLSFNARPARFQGLELNTFGEYTDFRHPTLVNGRRLIFYPSIAYAITRPYGFITPKIGYHLTRYDLTANRGTFTGGSRALPIVSLDSGLAFERAASIFGQSITQTLEPRLFYLYVPFRDQARLPQFSTSETDFNFAQIFNENLFVGGDRISDAKQLTAAVTTRFIENASGIERLRAAVGQRYYFRPQQVSLSNNALGSSSINLGDISRSDLLAAIGGQISNDWSLESSFQYSASDARFQKSNIAARYNADGGRIVNFSYRYTRESLKQIDISTQWPFGKAAPGWTLLARANHSLRDRRLLEGLIGVEYNQGCWEIRMVAHRFTTATNQYSNSIQIQLELKGLSKLGINPFDTIRQNISGYKRSDDR